MIDSCGTVHNTIVPVSLNIRTVSPWKQAVVATAVSQILSMKRHHSGFYTSVHLERTHTHRHGNLPRRQLVTNISI